MEGGREGERERERAKGSQEIFLCFFFPPQAFVCHLSCPCFGSLFFMLFLGKLSVLGLSQTQCLLRFFTFFLRTALFEELRKRGLFAYTLRRGVFGVSAFIVFLPETTIFIGVQAVTFFFFGGGGRPKSTGVNRKKY